jgi:tripartite-type tricarboxylate transporter receptor subunit TctC
MNKSIGCIAILTCAWVALLGSAQAQTYPAKPIRLVVPFGAGSAADQIGRRVAQSLSETLKQSVVVDNRPGASGVLASELVAKAPPDGYTLLLVTNSTHASNVTIFRSLPYDPVKDFVAIGQVASIPLLLVVHPDVPAKSVTELVAYGKANPGKLNAAYSGGAPQVAGSLFAQRGGIKVVDVSYKTIPLVMVDLIGGQVSYAFADFANGYAQAKAGKVRGLAVTSRERLSIAPEFPTMAESGFKDFEVVAWFGLAAPAGTDPAIVTRIAESLKASYATSQTRDFFAPSGIELKYSDPATFAAFIKSEIPRWAEMVTTAGIERQ